MNSFFAVINRMKYINRWGLMRNRERENLQEHSYQTAVLAHALAVIENQKFGADVNPERAAVMALYHDSSEIITGDMPTPVKYSNETLTSSYKQIETEARNIILKKLEPDLRPAFSEIFNCEESPEWVFVKAADTLSAYIKCIEEIKAGNDEFVGARDAIEQKLLHNNLKSLKYFIKTYLPAFKLTLDEQ